MPTAVAPVVRACTPQNLASMMRRQEKDRRWRSNFKKLEREVVQLEEDEYQLERVFPQVRSTDLCTLLNNCNSHGCMPCAAVMQIQLHVSKRYTWTCACASSRTRCEARCLCYICSCSNGANPAAITSLLSCAGSWHMGSSQLHCVARQHFHVHSPTMPFLRMHHTPSCCPLFLSLSPRARTGRRVGCCSCWASG